MQRARGAVILAVDGEIDLASAAALEAELLSLLRSGPHGLLLDLSAVSFIDCSGLNVLLRTCATAIRLGVEFRLCATSRPVARLLGLTIGRRRLARHAVQPTSRATARIASGSDALWWQASTIVPLVRHPRQDSWGSPPPASSPCAKTDAAAPARVYPQPRHLSALALLARDRASQPSPR